MPLTFVSGDPLLTSMQTLAFGHNARAKTELGTFEIRLLDGYPAAFASYRKQCHNGRIEPGDFWTWRESQPHLAFFVVRDSTQGATRLRYVESIMMTIARDYRLHGLESLAIAPLGSRDEWPLLKPVVEHWLAACPLPITIYERYEAGVAGE